MSRPTPRLTVADDLARTADLIIGFGTGHSDFTTASGTLSQHPDVRFLDPDITGFDAHKPAARTLVCDARAGLTALTSEPAGHRVDPAHEVEYRAGKERWEQRWPHARRSPAQAWWDAPVAETASRASAAEARASYEREVAGRHRHL